MLLSIRLDRRSLAEVGDLGAPVATVWGLIPANRHLRPLEPVSRERDETISAREHDPRSGQARPEPKLRRLARTDHAAAARARQSQETAMCIKVPCRQTSQPVGAQ